MSTLVIVESPSKAKTIAKYLGRDYVVRASMGHVRDLPARQLGVEVENGTFQPVYELVKGRFKTISEIKALAREASQVLLATDPDREGEAIAWHIVAAAGLSRGKAVSRVEFHEITERAIKAAMSSPRQINMDLVNAQQARRVLDRLVGYKISPLLWKKVQKGTSAGRVQSVALRIVVERERAIESFVPREFWTVEAELARAPFSKRKADIFRAILWNPAENKKLEFEKGDQAQKVVDDLQGAAWKVARIARKEAPRRPSPPFITSTLQQEAARKLRFKTQDTMRIAQQLYEGVSLGSEGNTGLITYMRTDSTQVAYEAQMAARDVIKELYGPEFLPDRPPFYAKKAKGAQEAHEAIRPTKPAREPDKIKQYLTTQQYQLYRLIWRRFVASQMAPAIVELTTVDVEARPVRAASPVYIFRASGERIVFPGFMQVYREGHGDSEEEEADRGGLPQLAEGDLLDLLKLLAEQHFTEPPPRYGEASLVKALEEQGVGRPSTYASILSTLRERGYVVELKEGKERKFHPTELGRAINDVLVARFPELMDVKFTARLEEELDEVAGGKRAWTPLVASFYGPLIEQLVKAEREMPRVVVAEETLPAPESKPAGRSFGRGRRGAGAGGGGSAGWKPRATRASNPDRAGGSEAPAKTGYRPAARATAPKAAATARRRSTTTPAPASASASKPVATEATPPTQTPAQVCPQCGKGMVRRSGPYGEFWGCTGFPGCRGTRKD